MPDPIGSESRGAAEQTIVTFVDVQTQWRGQPDTGRWRFYALIALSALFHSAFTPLAALLGLLGWLGMSQPVEAQDLPPITAIPVDILEDTPVEDSVKPSEPAADEPEGTTLSPPEPSHAAGDTPQPVAQEARDAGVEEPSEAKDGSEADDEENEEVGDPVALSGSAGKLADANANIRIKVDTEKVRRHPLGARIGEVLARVPQWYDFLGPAKLDPIRDIDRLLIAGPQLRDSSEVIAVLKYNVDQAAMETAVDSLVQRSSGQWLPGPTKAATARADRAERIFSFIAPGLIAIVPPSAKADALRVRPKGATFPPIPGDAVVTAFVQTPHRVYTGLPIRFPESFHWIRATVAPSEAGGAVAHIEIEDESEEDAKKNAEWLERRLIAATSPQGFAAAAAKFLYGGSKFLDEVSFQAKGATIQGTLSVTPNQLNILLSMVEGIVNTWNPKRPTGPAASASSGAPAASGVVAPNGSSPAPAPGPTATTSGSGAPPTPSAERPVPPRGAPAPVREVPTSASPGAAESP